MLRSSDQVGRGIVLEDKLGTGLVHLDSPGTEVGRDYLPKIILLNQGKASSSPCLSFLQLAPPVSPLIWHSWSSFQSFPPDSSIRTSSYCKL